MAKRRDEELFEKLRVSGLRKRLASAVADASDRVDPRKVIADLRSAADQIEDRLRGTDPPKPATRARAKSPSRTRSKAASTRSATKAKASKPAASKSTSAKRSEAGKKAARTRAANARKRKSGS